jgi:hypothetical protein
VHGHPRLWGYDSGMTYEALMTASRILYEARDRVATADGGYGTPAGTMLEHARARLYKQATELLHQGG